MANKGGGEICISKTSFLFNGDSDVISYTLSLILFITT